MEACKYINEQKLFYKRNYSIFFQNMYTFPFYVRRLSRLTQHTFSIHNNKRLVFTTKPLFSSVNIFVFL